MKPYLLVSDVHAHAWSSFATTLASGVNSRLQITLDELKRAVAELKAAGGDECLIAGDLFHVRGSVDPEVFNPVHDWFATYQEVSFVAIPGNHDLKSKDTTELGNAIKSLAGPKFVVAHKPYHGFACPDHVAVVPWRYSL